MSKRPVQLVALAQIGRGRLDPDSWHSNARFKVPTWARLEILHRRVAKTKLPRRAFIDIVLVHIPSPVDCQLLIYKLRGYLHEFFQRIEEARQHKWPLLGRPFG